MNALLKKLNFKDQKKVIIINPPLEFQEQISDFINFINVDTEIPNEKFQFCLLFVTEHQQITDLAPKMDALMDGDGLFWWVYPKNSSKKYKSAINRDRSWQAMGDLGYEPVRMVAVDEDWSALRFRKAIYIKKLTRDETFRMSEDGKNKQ